MMQVLSLSFCELVSGKHKRFKGQISEAILKVLTYK
jgi:hypothetical protein